MPYINTKTKKYPLSFLDIQQENPMTSFDATSIPAAYAWVFPTPTPTYDSLLQYVVEGTPKKTTDKTYEQTWQVVDKYTTQEEIDAAIAANEKSKLDAMVREVTQMVQNKLDDFAKSRNYDSILSAATYATSAIPKFQQEGQDAVNVRDTTWASLYKIMTDVMTGKRAVPTIADIMAELPVMEWTNK
jgi:hypothetical protein